MNISIKTSAPIQMAVMMKLRSILSNYLMFRKIIWMILLVYFLENEIYLSD